MVWKKEDLIKVFLPGFVLDSFDVTNIEDSTDGIHISLDEKKRIPKELSSKNIISYGLTSATTIQDFPIRGKAVHLHIRRRKRLDIKSTKVFTATYDLTYGGTQLTNNNYSLIPFFIFRLAKLFA